MTLLKVISRQQGPAEGHTRMWLSNGWFIDRELSRHRRTQGYSHALFAPGSSPTGGALFLGGSNTLRGALALARSQAASGGITRYIVSTYGRNHYVTDSRTGDFVGVAFTSKQLAQGRADEKNREATP